MNEQKEEFMLWMFICAIIGVFIWQMPNIERLVFGRAKKEHGTKTEEKVEQTKPAESAKPVESVKPAEPVKPATKTGKIVCAGTKDDNTTIEYVLSYEDSKVKKVTVNTKAIHQADDDNYKKEAKKCQDDAAKYTGDKGYTVTCNIDSLIIDNSKEFDLKTFKPINEDVDGLTTQIKINIDYDETVKKATETLTKEGLTCN